MTTEAGTVAKMPADELSVDTGQLISVACNVCFIGCDRMRRGPKGCRDGKGIDPLVLPPAALIAAPVELAMVEPADGDSEAVADLAPHRALLGKFDVMGI